MKEFDYDLDYKQLDFTDQKTRRLYRIGRGEQGVLLVWICVVSSLRWGSHGLEGMLTIVQVGSMPRNRHTTIHAIVEGHQFYHKKMMH